ncbi:MULTISPECIES: hypothetical protein [unclassified Rhizobium]|uniref:hypothetical protein n=1 Tax=unclassified Rhizobium TaxID=2613769 RepID=UPI00254F249C|nr:hypothetical protein [Rhizobium sp. CNPSo 4062]MDK4706448.1 hypothetical protein [Rhizobium sp. CNPSo 4062]
MTTRKRIGTGIDKRNVRQKETGQVKTSVDVSRSLSADRHHKPRKNAKPVEGDRDHYGEHGSA